MDQATTARGKDVRQATRTLRAIEAFTAAIVELNVDWQRDGGAMPDAADRLEALREQFDEMAELVLATADTATEREIERLELVARAAGVPEEEVNARVLAALEQMGERDEALRGRADALAGRAAPLRVVETA